MTRSLFRGGAALAALLAVGCGDGSPSTTGGATSAGAGGSATSVGAGGGGGIGGGSSGSSGSGGMGGAGGMGATGSSGGSICPADMALADGFCIDLYEAPNLPGERPLVMESAVSAQQWCV